MRFAHTQLSRVPPRGVKWPEGRPKPPGAVKAVATPSSTVSQESDEWAYNFRVFLLVVVCCVCISGRTRL